MTIKQAVSRLSQQLSNYHWYKNVKKDGKNLVVNVYNAYQASFVVPQEYDGYKVIVKETRN